MTGWRSLSTLHNRLNASRSRPLCFVIHLARFLLVPRRLSPKRRMTESELFTYSEATCRSRARGLQQTRFFSAVLARSTCRIPQIPAGSSFTLAFVVAITSGSAVLVRCVNGRIYTFSNDRIGHLGIRRS